MFFSKDLITKPTNCVGPPTEQCLLFLQGGRSQADAIFKPLLSFAMTRGVPKKQADSQGVHKDLGGFGGSLQYVNTIKPLILMSRNENQIQMLKYALPTNGARPRSASTPRQFGTSNAMTRACKTPVSWQPCRFVHHRTTRLRRWFRTSCENVVTW